MNKETIYSFCKQFQAAVKGDTTAVQAEKALRSATSALQVQISNMEGDSISLEDNVDNAKEKLKLARVNNGLVISDRVSYVLNLVAAQNNVTEAENALEDHKSVLAFLVSELTNLQKREEVEESK